MGFVRHQTSGIRSDVRRTERVNLDAKGQMGVKRRWARAGQNGVRQFSTMACAADATPPDPNQTRCPKARGSGGGGSGASKPSASSLVPQRTSPRPVHILGDACVKFRSGGHFQGHAGWQVPTTTRATRAPRATHPGRGTRHPSPGQRITLGDWPAHSNSGSRHARGGQGGGSGWADGGGAHRVAMIGRRRQQELRRGPRPPSLQG